MYVSVSVQILFLRTDVHFRPLQGAGQFPYAQQELIPKKVEIFPINPSVYPSDVQEYLFSEENDISNITEEIRETMLIIVNGTGEGYSKPATTDVEAIERIVDWNHKNLQVDEKFESFYPPYSFFTRMRSGDMFNMRLTRWSTSRATILSAELRAIGIPSKIFYHVDCECYPYEQGNCGRGGRNHPQNGAFVGNRWVIYEYVGDPPRAEPNGDLLVITDGYRDNSEANYDFWFWVVDTPRIDYPYDELYYVIERREN